MTEQYRDPDSLAERLDALLGAGEAPDLPEGDADPRVDAALRLARAPRPELSAEAMARIQERVLAAHSQQVAARPRPARYRPAQALRWAAAAAALLVVLLVAGLAPTVAASLPGDALYPVKRAVEGVELALASSAQEQAALHLTHAERRVGEAQALLQRGQFAPELVGDALDDLAAAARLARSEGGLPASVVQDMETRTIALVDELGGYVQQAGRSVEIPASTLVPVQATLQAAQLDGSLLLPLPPQPSATPTPSLVPSPEPPTLPALPAAQTPTATGSPWPTFTPTAPETETPTPPAPGSASPEGTEDAQPEGTEAPAGNGDGGYDCNNPPPTWAPAHGWRAQCEGAAPPAEQGQGQGRGRSDNRGDPPRGGPPR